ASASATPCQKWTCPTRKRRSRLRSEEHTSELQSLRHLVCRLLLEKKNRSSSTPASARRQPHASPRPCSAGARPASAPSPPTSRRISLCLARVAKSALFFFNDRAPPETSTLTLPDALPI